ncbi:hypothetical protein B7463_g6718, partial [Scytalidium lignicola]
MGSTEDVQPVGQFTHPVIDHDTKNNDPWQRPYFIPPRMGKLVPRSSPLIDIRPSISDPKYIPSHLLKTHGFGVVKHSSVLFEPPYVTQDLTAQTIAEVYYPEVRDLVKQTTGAKHVFMIGSVVRRGSRAPEEFKLPTGLRTAAVVSNGGRGEDKEIKSTEDSQYDKLGSRLQISLAKPIRIPHLDYTPLGARQAIRFQDQDIYNTALETGVIAAEDKICEHYSFSASSREADTLIAEQYNQNGKLGPRYTAYSIWRPLTKVERDPIALAPRMNSAIGCDDSDFVYWNYENRIPGPQELGGDFLKEGAMLGVRGESPVDSTTGNNSLKWYYVSAQQPDEVLFIKFFDSVALGRNAEEAGAPWHASPEIGSAEGDHPRESIELRILAFW